MNNKNLILNSIILILAVSLATFYYTKDDTEEFIKIRNQDAQHRYALGVTQNINEYLIRNIEHEVEKQIGLRPIEIFLKETYDVVRDNHGLLSLLRDQFLVMPEFDYENEKAPLLPNNYNKHHPVKSAFKTENGARDIADKWQSTQETLIDLIQNLSIQGSTTNNQKLDTLKSQLKYIVESSILNQNFSNEEKILKDIKGIDVLHASIYTSIIQQALQNMIYEIVSTCADFVSAASQVVEFDNFKLVMSPERAARVGKPFKADLFLVAYADDLDATMRVNGREIPVKDGIGYFDYTPQTVGENSFKADISVRNPFTGKVDNYSKTFKMEVIDNQ